MHNRNKTNVLLVEILLAVLFFMLSATVLVRVFASARNQQMRALAQTQAMAAAQNAADSLYTAADPEQCLTEMGFHQAHGAWTRNDGSFTLYAEVQTQDTAAGRMLSGTLSAFAEMHGQDRQEADELLSLPLARYTGGAK